MKYETYVFMRLTTGEKFVVRTSIPVELDEAIPTAVQVFDCEKWDLLVFLLPEPVVGNRLPEKSERQPNLPGSMLN